jgi:hypothetical protein
MTQKNKNWYNSNNDEISKRLILFKFIIMAKKSKQPLHNGWTTDSTKQFTYNEANRFLINDYNVGVLCDKYIINGRELYLNILDVDVNTPILRKILTENELFSDLTTPEREQALTDLQNFNRHADFIFKDTFTIISGNKRLKHYYFLAEKPYDDKIRLKIKNNCVEIGDLKSFRKKAQVPDVVTTAPSRAIHTDAKYEVSKDKDVNTYFTNVIDDFLTPYLIKNSSDDEPKQEQKVYFESRGHTDADLPSIDDVLTKLNKAKDKCPFCSNTGSGAFQSLKHKKYVYCCTKCKRSGDSIKLYMQLSQCAYLQALHDLGLYNPNFRKNKGVAQ